MFLVTTVAFREIFRKSGFSFRVSVNFIVPPPQTRRFSQESMRKSIGTHDGNFHCDESLACFLLRQTELFKDADIVRTRNPEILKQCSVVVDVGAVYDPTNHRYDHHQAGFEETLSINHNTKLSSAGLIYKHFGFEIIKNLVGANDRDTFLVYHQVYRNLIEAIDGIDNGVECYPPEIKPKYLIRTDISARVGFLNPRWNDPIQDFDERFKKAMQLVGEEFIDRVLYYGKSWLPARSIVEKAFLARLSVDPSGEIIDLPDFCPWREHLFQIEEENNLAGKIKYVLYPSDKSWRVQAVPISSSSFQNRLSLPKAWQGQRDETLSNISGIENCIFVHATGFIGGNKTKEGALTMAIQALGSTGNTGKRKTYE